MSAAITLVYKLLAVWMSARMLSHFRIAMISVLEIMHCLHNSYLCFCFSCENFFNDREEAVA